MNSLFTVNVNSLAGSTFFPLFFFFHLAMIIIDRSPSAADNKISSSGFPIVFSPNNIYSSSKEKVMTINTVITKGKML